MSRSRITVFSIATIMLAMAPSSALAQAWVPVKHSLSASVDYTFGPSDRIIEEDGVSFSDTRLNNHTVAIGAEFTPIDKLAVNLSIPIVTTRFTEGTLYPPHGSYDDGEFHTVLQDARFTARYNVLNSVVTVSPHIGTSIPMTDYETLGYAGAGRGLKQLHFGVAAGRYFTDGPLKNIYIHLLYEFSLVERYKTMFVETEQYGQNRSDLKFITGYFITDDLELNLGMDLRIAHGGLAFHDFQEDDPPPRWIDAMHDPLLKEHFLLLGGGVTYEIMEGFRFNAVFRYWTWGENTRDTHIIGGGFSWDVM